MQQLGESRFVRALLCASTLSLACPRPALAQAPGAPEPAAQAPGAQASTQTPTAQEPAARSPGIDPSLEEARELIKGGDYDRAIEVLKAAIAKARSHTSDLREAYLLLIKTYVFLGNDLKFKPQGREASNLNYKAARELIAECLRIKELRHTRPEPVSEYPPEMISLFAEVRSEIFGSFRVVELEPREAAVILDGDTLKVLPADSLVGDVDLPVGPHLVIVRRQGFMDVSDEIAISPNSTLERSYKLRKRRSGAWYAAVVTGTAAVIGGVIALVAKPSKTSGPATLAGPPPPPTN